MSSSSSRICPFPLFVSLFSYFVVLDFTMTRESFHRPQQGHDEDVLVVELGVLLDEPILFLYPSFPPLSLFIFLFYRIRFCQLVRGLNKAMMNMPLLSGSVSSFR